MANVLPLLLLGGVALVVMSKKKGSGSGSGSAPAPEFEGASVPKVASAREMINPNTNEVAHYRVVKDSGKVWSETRLPGGSWTQQRDKNTGELVYFATAAKAMHSGGMGLVFKGFTELGKEFYGEAARVL